MATTSATSGALQSLGIGSGIDINSLVTQLVTADTQAQTSRLTRETQQVATQISAVGQLKGALGTFQSALNGLNSLSDFQVKTAESGDDKTFTVSATSAAAPGNYNVEVLGLATAQQLRSGTFAGDGSGVVGTGTLTLSLGTKSFSVNLDDAHATLTAIRDAINSASDNPGISATIVHGSTSSQLVLSSNITGAANAIKVAVNNASGTLNSLAYDADHLTNYTQLQAASDASVKVAGVTVSSSTNTVNNVIDGVTLTLLKETTGTPVSLKVSNDNSTVLNRVQTLVNSYNTLQGVISKLSNYDSATNTAGPLFGDALITGLNTQLRRALGNSVSSISGNVNSLASIGVTTNKDGTLSLDASKFNNALATNFNVVGSIFGASDGIATALSKYVDGQLSTTSTLENRNKSLASRQKQVTNQQSVLAARQQKLKDRYTAQFTAMDKAMAQMQQTSSYLTQQFQAIAKSTSSN